MTRKWTKLLATALCLSISSLAWGDSPASGAPGVGGSASSPAQPPGLPHGMIRVPGRNGRNHGADVRSSTPAGANFDGVRARGDNGGGPGANGAPSPRTEKHQGGPSARAASNADIRARLNKRQEKTEIARRPDLTSDRSGDRRSDSKRDDVRPDDSRRDDGRNQGRIDPGASNPNVTTNSESAMSNRLAEIDRIRDAALARGDVDALQRADDMERRARGFGPNELGLRNRPGFPRASLRAQSRANEHSAVRLGIPNKGTTPTAVPTPPTDPVTASEPTPATTTSP